MTRISGTTRGWTCWIAAAVLAAGCATHGDRLREVRSQFYSGHVELADAKLDEYSQKYGGEADCFKLDRAMVALAAGRPQESVRLMREVRDSFDYLSQTNLAEGAATWLTDDTAASYAGEDYERILIRALLGISDLMAGGSDAKAYALQVSQLQEQIIANGTDQTGKNPKLAYQRVALGPFLHGVLCEQTHVDYDDAERYFVQVCSWEPGYAMGPTDVNRVRTGRHSMPGNGVVYVFTLVGRGPYKEQASEMPSSVSLLIADRIVNAVGHRALPPTIAPVKVPKVIVSYNTTRSASVTVDRQPAPPPATITNVSQLATQQYTAIYPNVLAKAVARRVLKKGVIYGAEEVANVSKNSPLSLAFIVGGVAWEASEVADTRCWGLLPETIQVVRVELPAGQHRIGVSPNDRLGSVGGQQEVDVHVGDGRNSYVLATVVDGRVVGKVLTAD